MALPVPSSRPVAEGADGSRMECILIPADSGVAS
jgi:hypothetical protein